jgi:ABC-type transporter Mla MlaB component
MIRIATETEQDAIMIAVDGTLVRDAVEPLEACVKRAMGDGRPVQLFLRDVSTIDDGGRAFLGRVLAQGVRLRAAGVYCSYIVEELSRSGTAGNGRHH